MLLWSSACTIPETDIDHQLELIDDDVIQIPSGIVDMKSMSMVGPNGERIDGGKKSFISLSEFFEDEKGFKYEIWTHNGIHLMTYEGYVRGVKFTEQSDVLLEPVDDEQWFGKLLLKHLLELPTGPIPPFKWCSKSSLNGDLHLEEGLQYTKDFKDFASLSINAFKTSERARFKLLTIKIYDTVLKAQIEAHEFSINPFKRSRLFE